MKMTIVTFINWIKLHRKEISFIIFLILLVYSAGVIENDPMKSIIAMGLGTAILYIGSCEKGE